MLPIDLSIVNCVFIRAIYDTSLELLFQVYYLNKSYLASIIKIILVSMKIKLISVERINNDDLLRNQSDQE